MNELLHYATIAALLTCIWSLHSWVNRTLLQFHSYLRGRLLGVHE